MALRDVVNHSDGINGNLSWVMSVQRSRNKGWRRESRMWTRDAVRDPSVADAVPEPTRSVARFRGSRNGRSIRWWVQGVVRMEGVVEIETLRKQVRDCVGAGRWRRLRVAFDAAVKIAIEQGHVL